MDKIITLTEKELEDLMIESSKDYNMTYDERHNMTMSAGTVSMVKRLIKSFKEQKQNKIHNQK